MNFGKWIVVSFIAFAAFIGTLATICMRQSVPLVSQEYYKEELAYDVQLEQIQNANSLAEKPSIFFSDNNLMIEYNQFSAIKNGQLKLVRPSDSGLDQQFELQPVSGNKEAFEIKHPVPGMYRAKLTWEQSGKLYFIEKVIIL